MTLTEKTAAIAATLGLSYSVTDDAAYLLRDGTVVGVVEDKPMADSVGVTCYYEKYGKIWSRLYGGKPQDHGSMLRDAPTRQRVDAADIKSRYTVLDVWRMLMPQSCPLKDGVYHSPFREERSPSFSISGNGTRFHDFGTGDGTDCIDFYQRATGCTWLEALNALASGMTNQPVLAPSPPKQKILAVTDTQREFERQSVEGFEAALADADSVLSRLLKAKGISEGVAKSLWKEGSLGAIDGKPVYLYPYGCKCRNEAETSRSTRFLCGSAHNHVWRHQLLQSPHIKTVFLVEGETDGMRLMSLIPQGLNSLVVAAPGTSWRPSIDYCFLIGAHRKVIIWMDSDQAGIDASIRLESAFESVSQCLTRRVRFRSGDVKDICEMSESRVLEIISEL